MALEAATMILRATPGTHAEVRGVQEVLVVLEDLVRVVQADSQRKILAVSRYRMQETGQQCHASEQLHLYPLHLELQL